MVALHTIDTEKAVSSISMDFLFVFCCCCLPSLFSMLPSLLMYVVYLFIVRRWSENSHFFG